MSAYGTLPKVTVVDHDTNKQQPVRVYTPPAPFDRAIRMAETLKCRITPQEEATLRPTDDGLFNHILPASVQEQLLEYQLAHPDSEPLTKVFSKHTDLYCKMNTTRTRIEVRLATLQSERGYITCCLSACYRQGYPGSTIGLGQRQIAQLYRETSAVIKLLERREELIKLIWELKTWLDITRKYEVE